MALVAVKVLGEIAVLICPHQLEEYVQDKPFADVIHIQLCQKMDCWPPHVWIV